MTRFLAITSSASFCLIVGACGSERDVDIQGPAVRVHALDQTPGCYVPPATPNSTESQMLSATQQMRFAQLSFAVQQADLLLWPVREDPTASEWSVSHQEGTRIEGQVLARGHDWGALTLVAIAEHADYSYSVHASVDYDPTRTSLDFGPGQVLVQTENSVSFTDIAIGCDPASGWSVVRVDGRTDCWDATGNRGEQEQGTGTEPKDEPGFAMSANMYCSQLAFRIL